MLQRLYVNSQLILITYLYTYSIWKRLLEPAERQSILKALFTGIGAGYNFFFSIARNAKRIGACETVRGSYSIISPQRDSRFSSWTASTKGDLPVYSAETYLGVHGETNQKKKEKRENDTESGEGEKGRLSQSVPCSRIMARTHCSNYLCIRLTALSAESAGRGTCVTNMLAHPYARVRVRVRAKKWTIERGEKKNKPRQGTALVGRIPREKKKRLTMLSCTYTQPTRARVYTFHVWRSACAYTTSVHCADTKRVSRIQCSPSDAQLTS